MKNQEPPFMVLMADDDEDDCLLVDIAFEEIGGGYDLHFVDDGHELLDYLYNQNNFTDPERYRQPDLILLDLNMPRIDGRAALHSIKSDPKFSGIPILILTTSKEKRDIDLTRQAGASSYRNCSTPRGS